MSIRVGINGFGRMGRLALRAAWGNPEIEFVHINDPAENPEVHAHLLQFDSIHGRWDQTVTHDQNQLIISHHPIRFTQNKNIVDTDWSQCDIVLECSGVMRKKELLQQYLHQGVKKVIVSAPVKEEGILNIVMGVNDEVYLPDQHHIVTAASCTTNCLAPVVKVLHESLGIHHGSMTTIHDLTNTQTIVDAPHKDLRRARACSMSLIPTTTGSATAITRIFPELEGRLNGHAIRVPLLNASLTDCVFEVKKPTTAEEVNALFRQASEKQLKDILGYEDRPLVSIDYRTDPRSSIIDGLSTLVINSTQVKVYAWYDNEWGYVNRMGELAVKLGRHLNSR
ncbi:ArsJ-associated glyceraldehyde-3-phosphate dehydrogenase [Hahella ganghwensis]|uniref:ArsJ-associated glyceraldehyde-3-phosphate dehydrogenase n=1 Tax=Hahella ganghwensis TaxID=286420 RepID=UPI000373DD34|nr:ArsJ-associated glyceraldehyde-3-phosphate dehydrogenase [Hahella ganghwensis]